ncbi:PLP-dependent transferase [Zopfia rhizophila CBS 207.26]|uniref:PLP-dependent transferase n=1 Tax=Zopfia rhizophila CBS 207.26 TaxID=1314779 RepID=A0A6A6DZ28_9PEZI|nr:PLP-dependent transferase [Zopfia rhizophila CBS 207.26]
MDDLHETIAIDYRFRGLSGAPHPKHGTEVQEKVAHPLANVPEGKLGSLNALQALFKNDARPHKADLMCGVYQTQEGNPYVLLSVKLARQMLFDDQEWEHEYPASHLGEAPFRDMSARLLFGETSQTIRGKRQATIFPSIHAFDFNGLNESLTRIPPQSIVVLQVCGNNPTGCDPSAEEWQRLAQTFQAKQHFAFLDLSYPGFVSGSVAEDCAPIRLIAEAGTPFLLAATYGKAFGLYGERVGHLCVPLPTAQAAARAEQQMKLLAREETGAQPRFGARLVANILGNPRLRMVWEEDLRGLAQDLAGRREALKRELLKQNVPGDWSFVTSQAGMFLYTSFDLEQVKYLREEHAVYLQDTGRLSIAGLNARNTAHVAESIGKAVGRQRH